MIQRLRFGGRKSKQSAMPRFKITIEYDGTPYIGWQMQADGPTVQGELSFALQQFCGEEIVVRGAGRTDAGVHACGQVAHIDLSREWETYKVRDALNYYLKRQPISIIDCEQVDASFDSRFSATARHYRYRILPRRAPAALDKDRVWWVPVPLDVSKMQAASQHLLGRHDFSTFRAAACQAKSPVRSLDRLDVFTHEDEIWIEASARSFLHHQVRSLAGALKYVGDDHWSEDDLVSALEARDRTRCAPVAPAHGLCFMRVDYD